MARKSVEPLLLLRASRSLYRCAGGSAAPACSGGADKPRGGFPSNRKPPSKNKMKIAKNKFRKPLPRHVHRCKIPECCSPQNIVSTLVTCIGFGILSCILAAKWQGTGPPNFQILDAMPRVADTKTAKSPSINSPKRHTCSAMSKTPPMKQ